MIELPAERRSGLPQGWQWLSSEAVIVPIYFEARGRIKPEPTAPRAALLHPSRGLTPLLCEAPSLPGAADSADSGHRAAFAFCLTALP